MVNLSGVLLSFSKLLTMSLVFQETNIFVRSQVCSTFENEPYNPISEPNSFRNGQSRSLTLENIPGNSNNLMGWINTFSDGRFVTAIVDESGNPTVNSNVGVGSSTLAHITALSDVNYVASWDSFHRLYSFPSTPLMSAVSIPGINSPTDVQALNEQSLIYLDVIGGDLIAVRVDNQGNVLQGATQIAANVQGGANVLARRTSNTTFNVFWVDGSNPTIFRFQEFNEVIQPISGVREPLFLERQLSFGEYTVAQHGDLSYSVAVRNDVSGADISYFLMDADGVMTSNVTIASRFLENSVSSPIVSSYHGGRSILTWRSTSVVTSVLQVNMRLIEQDGSIASDVFRIGQGDQLEGYSHLLLDNGRLFVILRNLVSAANFNFINLTVDLDGRVLNLNQSHVINEDSINLTLCNINITPSSFFVRDYEVNLTLSDPGAGSIETRQIGSFNSTYDVGAGVWHARGPIALVQAALTDLVLSVTPDYDQNFNITAWVDDGFNSPQVGLIDVQVNPINDPPVQVEPIIPPTGFVALPYSYMILNTIFSDVDDPVLNFNANISLPWLQFDPGLMTFSGMPGLSEQGSTDVNLTVSDSMGLTLSVLFTIEVLPSVSVANTELPINYIEDAILMFPPFTISSPANFGQMSLLYDGNVGVISFSNAFDELVINENQVDSSRQIQTSGAISVINQWVSTLVYTPGQNQNINTELVIHVNDFVNAPFESVVNVIGNDVNDPPTVNLMLGAVEFPINIMTEYLLPSGLFLDIDNDLLTLTVTLQGGSALPGWILFNSGNNSVSATPTEVDLGFTFLEILANDNRGGSTSTILQMDVNRGEEAGEATDTSADDNQQTTTAIVAAVAASSVVAFASAVIGGSICFFANKKYKANQKEITENDKGNRTADVNDPFDYRL